MSQLNTYFKIKLLRISRHRPHIIKFQARALLNLAALCKFMDHIYCNGPYSGGLHSLGQTQQDWLSPSGRVGVGLWRFALTVWEMSVMQTSVCKSMFPHPWQLCSEWRWHFDLIFNCLNSLLLLLTLSQWIMNSLVLPWEQDRRSGCSSLLLHGICCTREAPQCRGPPSGPVSPMTWKASLPIPGFYSRPVCCIPYLSLSELYKAASLILLFLGNCIIICCCGCCHSFYLFHKSKLVKEKWSYLLDPFR